MIYYYLLTVSNRQVHVTNVTQPDACSVFKAWCCLMYNYILHFNLSSLSCFTPTMVMIVQLLYGYSVGVALVVPTCILLHTHFSIN